jgi:hypothetical protein
MRTKLSLVGIALFILICAVPAQADIRPGVRGGGYFDSDSFFIGGEILTPVATDWYFNPNVEFAFSDRADLITFNFDFHYDFETSRNLYVWVGAGPAVIYRDPEGRIEGDTDFGANIFMGLGFRTGTRLIPYIQPKVIVADNSEFSLAFGVRF